MAPEILALRWVKRSDHPGYNERCDVWSLGMVFVEFLLGYNPVWKKICNFTFESDEKK